MNNLLKIALVVIVGFTIIPKVVSASYKLPWPAGVSYGYWQDWHDDFGWSIDVGTTGSDRRIIAAQDGTVFDVCWDQTSAAVLVNNADGSVMKYYHLKYNSLPAYLFTDTREIKQGQYIGNLKKGTFGSGNHKCGYTAQNPISAHLHWVIPSDGLFEVDGWKLNYPNSGFYKGSITNQEDQGGNFLTSTNILNNGELVDCFNQDVYLVDGNHDGPYNNAVRCAGLKTLTMTHFDVANGANMDYTAPDKITLANETRINAGVNKVVFRSVGYP